MIGLLEEPYIDGKILTFKLSDSLLEESCVDLTSFEPGNVALHIEDCFLSVLDTGLVLLQSAVIDLEPIIMVVSCVV